MASGRQTRLRRVLAARRSRLWRSMLLGPAAVLTLLAAGVAIGGKSPGPVVSGAFVMIHGTSLVFGHTDGRYYVAALLHFAPGFGYERFPRAWIARFEALPLLALAAVPVLVVVASRWDRAETASRRLQDWVNQATCRACGYDLSGLARTGRCPECGRGFQRLRPPDTE